LAQASFQLFFRPVGFGMADSMTREQLEDLVQQLSDALEQQKTQNDAQVAAMEELVNQQESTFSAQLEDLQEQLAEKDRVIGDLSELIEAQESTIHQQRAIVEDQQQLLEDLQEAVQMEPRSPVREERDVVLSSSAQAVIGRSASGTSGTSSVDIQKGARTPRSAGSGGSGGRSGMPPISRNPAAPSEKRRPQGDRTPRGGVAHSRRPDVDLGPRDRSEAMRRNPAGSRRSSSGKPPAAMDSGLLPRRQMAAVR